MKFLVSFCLFLLVASGCYKKSNLSPSEESRFDRMQGLLNKAKEHDSKTQNNIARWKDISKKNGLDFGIVSLKIRKIYNHSSEKSKSLDLKYKGDFNNSKFIKECEDITKRTDLAIADFEKSGCRGEPDLSW